MHRKLPSHNFISLLTFGLLIPEIVNKVFLQAQVKVLQFCNAYFAGIRCIPKSDIHQAAKKKPIILPVFDRMLYPLFSKISVYYYVKYSLPLLAPNSPKA
jgi:hypothetical protein